MHTRTLLLFLLAGLMLALPSAAVAYTPHDIAPGESLYSIAAADGLSISQLAAANGLSPSAHLLAGATLQIPPQGVSSGVASSGVASGGAGSAAGAATTAGASTTGGSVSSAEPAGDDAAGSVQSGGGGGYVVQPGDTLSALALRYGTSVAALAANNGLDPNGILRSGVKLQLSAGGGATTSSSSAPVASTATTTTPQPVGVNSPPYPTPERVSGSEVGSIANANGVPPSLAQAIGWQESGFNNALVSGADARGVMQILPTT
ncbi:MAG: LysM peptidoglycan-binding domain-containing protein, partial [Solirubrobacterales bacterium]|nr:LysM peptidoglycan-binding domain-containing protein [Solirubrobacterales bacterium]